MYSFSEKKIHIILLAIISLFIIQEALTNFYIGQPYPALKMPAFSNTHINEDGYYDLRSLDIMIIGENDQIVEIPRKLFFSIAPTSHHSVLSKKFRPADKSEKKLTLQE